MLEPGWLAPGAHVNSACGSLTGRGELPAELCREAALFVESRTTFQPPPAGAGAPELAGLDPQVAAELGEVLAGGRPGRSGAAALTVYKSVGHAAEDACAAAMVYRRAREVGAGSTADL